MLEWGLIVYALGFLGSVVFPYIEAYLADPTIVFDWRYVFSRLVGSTVPLLLILVSPETLVLIENALMGENGALLMYLFIFMSGWGSAAVGQLSRKTFNTVQENNQ